MILKNETEVLDLLKRSDEFCLISRKDGEVFTLTPLDHESVTNLVCQAADHLLEECVKDEDFSADVQKMAEAMLEAKFGTRH